MTKNERLASELEREKMWKDTEFQRRLQELQKSLFSPGGVGGSTGSSVQFAPQGGQIGQFGGGPQTSMDRFSENNPLEMAMLQNRRSTMMNYRPSPGMGIPGPADTPYTAQFGSLGDPKNQQIWQQWIAALMGRR